MDVLFVMPNWDSPSELWMHRMIGMMDEQVDTIACFDPKSKYYKGKIPTLNLHDRSLYARVRGKLNRPSKEDLRSYMNKVVQATIKKKGIKKLFIHYLTSIIDLKKTLENVDIPIYVHCHGFDVMWDRLNSNGVLLHPESYVREVKALSNKITFIANSEYTAGRLREIDIKDEHIIIKSYGVEYPLKPKIREKRDKLKILYLGRFTDFKGPDMVVQAFDLARRKGMNAELIMAGDGPLMFTCEVLRRRSVYKDDIHFLGVTDATTGIKLRDQADIFTAHNCKGIFSNQEEALGVSILEAMSAALPVVSGRNGALVETVANQETGILVEPGSVEEHAEAFLQLANNYDLRISMGVAGWERVKSGFSYNLEKKILSNIFGN